MCWPKDRTPPWARKLWPAMGKLRWESQRTRLGVVVNDPVSYRLVDGAGIGHGSISRQGASWKGFDRWGGPIGTFADKERAKEAVHRRAHQPVG